MPKHITISLRMLRDGEHFWDPDSLEAGAKHKDIHTHSERQGKTFVVIHRGPSRRGAEYPRKEYWPSTTQVVRGEMPPKLRAEVDEEMKLAEQEREDQLAVDAAQHVQSGAALEYIAAQITHQGEEATRNIIARGFDLLQARAEEEASGTEAEAELAPQPQEIPVRRAVSGTVKAGVDPQDVVDAKAWQLRKEGLSFREIAQRIGYASNTSARNAAARGRKAAGE